MNTHTVAPGSLEERRVERRHGGEERRRGKEERRGGEEAWRRGKEEREGEATTYTTCRGEVESKGVELSIIDPEGRDESSQSSLQGGGGERGPMLPALLEGELTVVPQGSSLAQGVRFSVHTTSRGSAA